VDRTPIAVTDYPGLRVAVTEAVGTFAAMTQLPAPWIEFAGAHNVRDLGGHRIAGDRLIRHGRLFRADGLANLTDDDLDLLDALGIRTVIDLRSATELTERGRFPLERYPVAFHHLPIVDVTWVETGVPVFPDTPDGAVDFLVWAYHDMLATGAERFAAAIGLLASADAMPAMFHCAAGKDRTGILAALILGGLGVDDEAVAADYALTAIGMQRMRAWIEVNSPESFALMNDRPAMMFSSDPAAIARLLADLRESHGSIAGYLASIGVSGAVLAELADRLTC
jgi:protein-tyrosine phosphatase